MEILQQIIDLALTEDVGLGDITTDNLIDKALTGKGNILAKESLILAGMDVVRQVFLTLDPDMTFKTDYKDGDRVEKGTVVFFMEGNLRALLKGERTALNFFQRLCGIATHVRSYVDIMPNDTAKLVDTRKTTPGWRQLEKYAVRVGGAYNHRMALYDGVLIKDNHIAVAGGIKNAVEKIRKTVSHLVKIEVEVSNMEELEEAVTAKADVIMLDNMDIPEIKTAVKKIGGKALVEVSGGVTRERLVSLAETGVDIISSGALTHQATSVDISMNIELQAG